MRLIDLPKNIRNIAIDRALFYFYLNNRNLNINFNTEIDGLFIYSDTIEGHDVWLNVNRGNYRPFYDFHKIEDFPRVVMVNMCGYNNYKPRVAFKKVHDIYVYWNAENIEDSLMCISSRTRREQYVMEVTDYIEKYGNRK